MTTSFSKDIRPMFTNRDDTCMRSRDVMLLDYDYMSSPLGDGEYEDHANANHVYARLTGSEQPRMPSGGPFWSRDKLDKFKEWMDACYPP